MNEKKHCSLIKAGCRLPWASRLSHSPRSSAAALPPARKSTSILSITDCGCDRPSGRRRDADHLQGERHVRFGALDGGAVFLLPARVGLGHVSAHGAGHGRQADQPRSHRHVCLQLRSDGAFHHRPAGGCLCGRSCNGFRPDARSGAERRGRRRAHPDHLHFDHPRFDFDCGQYDLRHRHTLRQRC